MQDLSQISDYDFEQVIADLLGAEWRVRVEYFPRGRDSGVDLRVLGPTPGPLNLPPHKELIIQCKHMPTAAITQLRRHLREEASKDIVGEAYRYVFVTSARLTRANKQEIAEIFAGHLSETDILGREDIDALLRSHPEVVQANMKLWLASGTALQAFLNQTEHIRSNLLQAELEQLRPRFVQTSIVSEAQQMLRRFGVCILAGAPGVGKTTTAKILLLQYLSEGWRPAVATSDIRELEVQLLPGVRQILFFDDFLGITTLPSKLAQGDDADLLRLIHLVEDDSSKAFVLTTRDYILRQAQQTYEKLNDEAFRVTKLVVNIQSLTQPERAHILYNQLFFSPLRQAAAAVPNSPSQYMALTRHPNYNPRLIEAAIAATVRDLGIRPVRLPEAEHPTDSGGRNGKQFNAPLVKTSEGELPDVPALLRRALDHPGRLWEHVLLHQLTQLQREVLITRLSLGSAAVGIADFIEAVRNLASAYSANKPSLFTLDMSLKVLDGDLLSVTKQSRSANQLLVNGLQPGLTDSLTAMLHTYPDYLRAVITSASTFEQVQWLAEFLGIVGRSRPTQSWGAVEYWTELVKCAERNLTASPIAMDHGLLFGRPHKFSDFGARLGVLSAVYVSTGNRSSSSFADEIVPQFLEAIPKIPNEELVRVLRELREDVFQGWRWRRTEINAAILGRLDNPTDVKEWSILRDSLDFIETIPEYDEELKEQFDDFLESSIGEAYDVVYDANEGEDVYLPLDEMIELDSLAGRWGSATAEIDDLVSEISEIQDRRDEAESEQRRRERSQSQPTLFETTEAEPRRGDSIFDHL